MAHKRQQQKPAAPPATPGVTVATGVAAAPAPPPPGALRARWEYRVTWMPTFLFDEESATWGAEGWKLVAVVPRQATAMKTDALTGRQEPIVTAGADCYWERLLVEEEEEAA